MFYFSPQNFKSYACYHKKTNDITKLLDYFKLLTERLKIFCNGVEIIVIFINTCGGRHLCLDVNIPFLQLQWKSSKVFQNFKMSFQELVIKYLSSIKKSQKKSS